MDKENIIRMAREAGWNWPEVHTTSIEDRLERFAALVAAAEREAISDEYSSRLAAQVAGVVDKRERLTFELSGRQRPAKE
jgi:hypothetical protein